MGYYTSYYGDIEIKDDDEFNKAVEVFRQECEQYDEYMFPDWFNHYTKGHLSINSDVKAGVDEITSLLVFIAKHAETGEIEAKGEDPEDINKIVFDGKGGYKILTGTLIFDHDPYKEFMDAYGEELPPTLKTKIEEWKVAREI